MRTIDEASEYWVCVDCYFAHQGTDENPEYPPDREPLSLIPADAEVTDWAMDADDENDERSGEHEFSWAPCDGCGSTLGGSRHRLAVWEAS